MLYPAHRLEFHIYSLGCDAIVRECVIHFNCPAMDSFRDSYAIGPEEIPR